jgi:DNA polymerase-1
VDVPATSIQRGHRIGTSVPSLVAFISPLDTRHGSVSWLRAAAARRGCAPWMRTADPSRGYAFTDGSTLTEAVNDPTTAPPTFRARLHSSAVERLMLLDAHSLIYRAYFALLETPLTTSKGQLVNAAFGFWSIVLRGFADMQPDHVLCCFDVGRSFRADRFEGYKATRRPTPDDLREQFPIVRETLRAFGIPIHEVEGFEADDLIGSLTRQAELADLESIIVSGDLDMLQLVTERTKLMTTRLGVQSTVIYDPERIHERYGLEPGQMIDFKALKGDSTDNIPGIPGVGDKTAAKLLIAWGTLEGIYSNINDVKPDKLREKLKDHRDEVMLWRELVTIDRLAPIDLDLGGSRLEEYDRSEVLRLFREYEFRSLVERLPDVAGEATPAAGDLLREADRHGPVPAAQVPGRGRARKTGTGEGSSLQLTLDFGAVAGSTPEAEPAVVPDLAAEGLDPRDHLLAVLADPGSAEAAEPGEALAAWLAAQPELVLGVAFDDVHPRRGILTGLAVAGSDGRIVTASGDATAALADAVFAADRPLAGHELKPLLVWELARRDPAAASCLSASGGSLPAVGFDTQIAAYILNAALRSQSLADICAERLDVEIPPVGTLDAAGQSAVEAAAVAASRGALEVALEAEPSLRRILEELELPLVPVLADMEATGVALDRDALAALAEAFGETITRLAEDIYASVGHEFNLGSPKQLEQVLFYELDLPKGKRTKTGYSTSATVLEELRAAHPMVPMLLDWRVYTKLKSTYVDALPQLIDADTSRLHTTFQQAVASTGRLSSADPNLQNIPVRSDLGRKIRSAFVAGDPDRVLLAADYSQIELRVLAHVSGDVHLKEAFERGADIHRETAARVLKKEPDEVSADERSMAKMVNFGLAYGMSDYGLATRAGIPREEAKAFIESYFSAYSGIAYYMLHIKEVARDQGYVETLLGRRRWIPELGARNVQLRGAGERMAINMPIQGTAADIMKIALIRVHERLRADRSAARMLLSVHDEVLLEAPREEAEGLAPVVREIMQAALKLDVPLDVDVKIGDDWESMTPMAAA